MNSLVGRQLGKYRLVELLGSGGMAEVYRGIQVGLEREVAVKVLTPAHVRDRELVKRFRRESQATAKLAHPNIITIYDSGEQDGYHYYVMEYLRAETLEGLLAREQRLPLVRVIKITQEILKALVYTHDKDILHRDLKPANIKFDPRENAIVTDFGLVKDLGETAITLSGASMGTPRYMSPEQQRGDEIDARSDLYQVGLMMHEMLTGGLPGEAACDTWPEDGADEVREFLDRALERDPASRFQCAKEMVQDLRKVELKGKARRLCERSTAVETRAVSLQVDTRTLTAASSVMETSGPSSDSIWASSIAAILESAEDREAALRLLARAMPAVMLGMALVFWGLRPAAAPPPAPVVIEVPRPRIEVFNIHVEEHSEHVILTWETSLRTNGTVWYGERESDLEEVVSNPEQANETMHMVTVHGLSPGSHRYYQIESKDPRGRAAPHRSEILTFVTHEEMERDPSQSLIPLVKSYIDKLTRMTPDERIKLHQSVSQFAKPSGDIGAETKKELRETATVTREDRFQDRLRQVRNWMVALRKQGRVVTAADELAQRAAKQFGTNPVRAAEQLDAVIVELGKLERR